MEPNRSLPPGYFHAPPGNITGSMFHMPVREQPSNHLVQIMPYSPLEDNFYQRSAVQQHSHWPTQPEEAMYHTSALYNPANAVPYAKYSYQSYGPPQCLDLGVDPRLNDALFGWPQTAPSIAPIGTRPYSVADLPPRSSLSQEQICIRPTPHEMGIIVKKGSTPSRPKVKMVKPRRTPQEISEQDPIPLLLCPFPYCKKTYKGCGAYFNIRKHFRRVHCNGKDSEVDSPRASPDSALDSIGALHQGNSCDDGEGRDKKRPPEFISVSQADKRAKTSTETAHEINRCIDSRNSHSLKSLAEEMLSQMSVVDVLPRDRIVFFLLSRLRKTTSLLCFRKLLKWLATVGTRVEIVAAEGVEMVTPDQNIIRDCLLDPAVENDEAAKEENFLSNLQREAKNILQALGRLLLPLLSKDGCIVFEGALDNQELLDASFRSVILELTLEAQQHRRQFLSFRSLHDLLSNSDTVARPQPSLRTVERWFEKRLSNDEKLRNEMAKEFSSLLLSALTDADHPVKTVHSTTSAADAEAPEGISLKEATIAAVASRARTSKEEEERSSAEVIVTTTAGMFAVPPVTTATDGGGCGEGAVAVEPEPGRLSQDVDFSKIFSAEKGSPSSELLTRLQ